MQIPAFAEGGFSVYAVDSLGFGGSGKATRPLEGEGIQLVYGGIKFWISSQK